eukprot:3874353-Prymnesium_polylepis.2
MGSSPAVVASNTFEVRMQRAAFSKISAALAGKAVGPVRRVGRAGMGRTVGCIAPSEDVSCGAA